MCQSAFISQQQVLNCSPVSAVDIGHIFPACLCGYFVVRKKLQVNNNRQ